MLADLYLLNVFVFYVKATPASGNDEISHGWNTKGSCNIHRARTYLCSHIHCICVNIQLTLSVMHVI